MSTSTHALANDHDDAFVQPANGFFADEVVGRGHVQLPDHFQAIDIELQLRILRDWRCGIDAQLLGSLVACFRRLFPEGEGALPDRLTRFRKYCESRGIDLPSDFALALQQH